MLVLMLLLSPWCLRRRLHWRLFFVAPIICGQNYDICRSYFLMFVFYVALPFCLILPLFILSFVQVDLWLNESVRMHVPKLFVRTRWHSKYLMIQSLVQNKELLRAMFDLTLQGDESCKALLGHILTDAEWEILEVRSEVM